VVVSPRFAVVQSRPQATPVVLQVIPSVVPPLPVFVSRLLQRRISFAAPRFVGQTTVVPSFGFVRKHTATITHTTDSRQQDPKDGFL